MHPAGLSVATHPCNHAFGVRKNAGMYHSDKINLKMLLFIG